MDRWAEVHDDKNVLQEKGGVQKQTGPYDTVPVKLRTNIDANDERLFASPSSFKRLGIFSNLQHQFLGFKWKT